MALNRLGLDRVLVEQSSLPFLSYQGFGCGGPEESEPSQSMSETQTELLMVDTVRTPFSQPKRAYLSVFSRGLKSLGSEPGRTCLF